MKTAEHLESLKKGIFVMVCHGENYSAEVINGSQILEKIHEAMFGDPNIEDTAEWRLWRDEIEDPDHWSSDLDFGTVSWGSDVGETDRIELFRITDLQTIAKLAQ